MHESALAILLFFCSPNWQYYEGITLSKQNNYEKSEEILLQINRKSKIDRDTYHFYRMLNNFMMNKKSLALKYGQDLEDNFGSNLAERYQVVSALMKNDLQRWKEDDLEDVSRDMRKAKDRITSADITEKTQTLQKDIVAKLDKLIKEKEDQANKQNDKDKDKAQGGSDGGQQPSNPAGDSNISGEQSTGKVQAAKTRSLLQKWGSLPPKEREQALQKLTENLSPRHKEAIENYFRNLANAGTKK